MTYEEMIKNQALSMHALMFDSVNRRFDIYADPGEEIRGHYVMVKPGVRLLPNGDVEFNFYAPNARTVEGQAAAEECLPKKQRCTEIPKGKKAGGRSLFPEFRKDFIITSIL